MGSKKALLFYESRETGLIREVWLNYVRSVGQQIDAKNESGRG